MTEDLERGPSGTDPMRILRKAILLDVLPTLGISLLLGGGLLGALWNIPGGAAWALAIASTVVAVVPAITAVNGAAAGLVLTVPDSRRVVERQANALLLRVYLIAVPVCLLVALGAWASGLVDIPFATLVVLAGALLAIVGGYAFGYLRGAVQAVRQSMREARDRAALVASEWLDDQLERWQEGTLAQRRKSLEQAIETRFGPLDDSARQRLQSWDQERLLQAARTLTGAGSTRDLGLVD
jgi:hypothetical protein